MPSSCDKTQTSSRRVCEYRRTYVVDEDILHDIRINDLIDGGVKVAHRTIPVGYIKGPVSRFGTRVRKVLHVTRGLERKPAVEAKPRRSPSDRASS